MLILIFRPLHFTYITNAFISVFFYNANFRPWVHQACALYQAEIILYSLPSKSSKGSRKRAKNHFSILQSCIKMYKIKLTIENKVYCKKMRQFKSFQVGKLCNQCESNKEIKKRTFPSCVFFSLLECKKLWKLLKAERKEGVRLIVSLN